MEIYEKSSFVQCDIEALFNFHTNTDNLQRITPKDIKAKILTPNFQAKHRELLHLKTSKFGLSTTWVVQITKVEPPILIEDTAMVSPFKFWRHSHHFIEHENSCELKDVVEYALPLGLTKLLKPLVNKQLDAMFSYRHQETIKYLEGS